jgi:monoamine oxidase
LNGKLYLSGSETALQHPGYMDGVVAAAKLFHLNFNICDYDNQHF